MIVCAERGQNGVFRWHFFLDRAEYRRSKLAVCLRFRYRCGRDCNKTTFMPMQCRVFTADLFGNVFG